VVDIFKNRLMGVWVGKEGRQSSVGVVGWEDPLRRDRIGLGLHFLPANSVTGPPAAGQAVDPVAGALSLLLALPGLWSAR